MEYITEFNRLKHHIITNYGQPNWLLLVRGTGLTLHDPEVQPLRDLWYNQPLILSNSKGRLNFIQMFCIS